MLLTGIGGCENVNLKKTERPDAANYQHRIVMKAHKKAELMKKNFEITIQKIQFREFKVKSSQRDSFYTVSYDELCENECKQNFCRVCKMCVHPYKCECLEYLKNTMCTWSVCMIEKGVLTLF
jgi:hypothetical protein